MVTFAFAAPVLPGKEETTRQMIERLQSGEEHEAYVEARRAAGATRERVWFQETPDGTLVVVLLEGEEDTMQRMATSDSAFDVSFREYVKDVHGIDMAENPVPRVPLLSDTSF